MNDLTFNTPIDAVQHDITLLKPCAKGKNAGISAFLSTACATLHKISSPFSELKLAEKLSSGVEESASGCWVWTRTLLPNGYAQIAIGGRRKEYLHRLFYLLAHGYIPNGLQLDHLCRNRSCCRPDHLQPVTCRENLLRGQTIAARNATKSACANGHEYGDINLYIEKYKTRKGEVRFGRRCRICRGLPPAVVPPTARDSQQSFPSMAKVAINHVSGLAGGNAPSHPSAEEV